MRRIKVGAFVSLDGVMQAPGGPDEDRSGGFGFGGWTAPLFDETVGNAIDEMMGEPFSLLLGRKTYDIFSAHWPLMPADDPIARLFNRIDKHVASRNPALRLDWANSHPLGQDVVGALRALKASPGPDLLTQGSTELLATLMTTDLVDEITMLVFPVVLGRGKRLFAADAMPGEWALVSSTTAPSGVACNRYRRVGPIRTGSFALPGD
ncbi:dihydrofolate reductase [Arsenicitalea aurantiaca]|uniref:Dihydrofolate reductase n=1 Tax=Arsenicitalea aurantiaca TaxID=1783274 RepID=A0A433XBI8_9HYPH|nr:dihydrofolate reductase family protein [Arsenicitalea aurantiaca]RUT31390.1 dihydrofolate reductase [Arsenicitalea aurantiaca]